MQKQAAQPFPLRAQALVDARPLTPIYEARAWLAARPLGADASGVVVALLQLQVARARVANAELWQLIQSAGREAAK